MDYSQLKAALNKGPLVSGTNEPDGMYLRELVWIECLKALIINTENTQTEEDRSGVSPHTDRVIASNVTTACKYAGQFMNQRNFFDTCYAAPLQRNFPSGAADIMAIAGYPLTVPLDYYGYDTPLFDWDFDWITNRFKVTINLNLETFGLEYGCGWDYCQIKLYIEEDFGLGTIFTLQYNPLVDSAEDSKVDTGTLYPWCDGCAGLEISSGTFIYYPTQVDLDNNTNGIVSAANGVGISTEQGLSWRVFPWNYNYDLWTANNQILDDTGVINTIASTGGLKPNKTYKIKVGYKCGNTDGVCTGPETFSTEYTVTTPFATPYPSPTDLP